MVRHKIRLEHLVIWQVADGVPPLLLPRTGSESLVFTSPFESGEFIVAEAKGSDSEYQQSGPIENDINCWDRLRR